MKVQLRHFLVDGLNIDSSGFNWKNRLLFNDSKKPNENIANVYVKIQRPLIETPPKDGFQYDKEISESLHLITIFLSCYGLANNKSLPILEKNSSSAAEIEEKEIDLKNIRSWSVPLHPSKFPPLPIKETMQALNNTIPLFDNVIDIIENGSGHKLDVALIMYYRSVVTFDFMEGFVDLITAFEALYSDSSADLTYKIALRTSVFTETDPIKRRELFDYFRKDVYPTRSSLVHGKDVSFSFVSPYHLHQFSLRKTMETSLLNYIKLASQGKSKTDVLKHIDNIALGMNL